MPDPEIDLALTTLRINIGLAANLAVNAHLAADHGSTFLNCAESPCRAYRLIMNEGLDAVGLVAKKLREGAGHTSPPVNKEPGEGGEHA